jgi:uncharacterized RDD family membrane protein YckC
MNENYLKEFERWTAGPEERRRLLSAEIQEHLRDAEAAGELGPALERLGPPRDAARVFAAGHQLTPAKIGRRVMAFLTDVLIVALVVGAGIAIVLSGSAAIEPDHISNFTTRDGTDIAMNEIDGYGVVGILFFAVACLWWVVGLTLLEWRGGRTPGKAALGLRVVTEDGTAPSFGQVVVRRLTLVFSGPLQLIDWVFAFFNPNRQRAVEKLAHTMVIQDDGAARGVGVPAPNPS